MFKKLAHFVRKQNESGDRLTAQAAGPPRYSSDRSVSRGFVPPSGEKAIERQTSLSSKSPAETSSYARPEDPLTQTQGKPAPLGLNVIYSPPEGHNADIVFVHGLGGSSISTWTKSKDPELFWPRTFLPLEPTLCSARVLTFGYNAAFRKLGNISTSMLDFAKDLLFELKYATDSHKNVIGVGKVPLIFVAHSMGGLVVKEAYLQGQHDPEYESIVHAIRAIVFFATPHRGTNLAQTLNRILNFAMTSNQKQYVTELVNNSITLQKLNEQFRHVAPRMELVSFYETQKTPVGFKNNRIMIVEKESSVLGYPAEISKALDANHQNICKFDDPTDPNYLTVRNTLSFIVNRITSTDALNTRSSSTGQEPPDLKALMGTAGLPMADYSFFRDKWTRGTTDWILEDSTYLDWRTSNSASANFLWLNGGPAQGKSVMASFIINTLAEEGACCQHFFIRFGDKNKRSLSAILRSIAYQLSMSLPGFGNQMAGFVNEGMDFEAADSRMIWERVFKSILFKMKGLKPLFWIIDGLDEATDPKGVIRLLSEISSATPIRILVTSRKTLEIETSFRKLFNPDTVRVLDMDSNQKGMRHHIRQELNMDDEAHLKENTVERIMSRAGNNFLWVRLVVDKVNLCHRTTDVEAALQELPHGMEGLYDRMASDVQQNTPAAASLAIAILQCVAFSLRVLSIEELSEALGGAFSDVLDLPRSIVNVCGGFIAIDNDGRVALIHETAREFLLGKGGVVLGIDRKIAHEQLFLSCMRCLMVVGLRGKVSRGQPPEFADYAATMWAPHLASTSEDSSACRKSLRVFLTGQWVLTWIYYLATNDKVKALIHASSNLSIYVSKCETLALTNNDSGIDDTQIKLFKCWATDMVKVAGRFGATLHRNPESIYKLIPPFCPKSSSIYQLFGRAEAKTLMVSGVSSQDWDDSVARISLEGGEISQSVCIAGSCIAVFTTEDTVHLYDSFTFEEYATSPIAHDEALYLGVLNSTGTLLATCGYSSTKVWKTATGECVLTIPCITQRPHPLAVVFTEGDGALLVAFQDNTLRRIDIRSLLPIWEDFADLAESELEGYCMNSPNLMTLSRDGNLIAVAYPGHPLSAFETNGAAHIGHCWRKAEAVAPREVKTASWLPYSPELLGIYVEGTLFKWNPYSGEIDELFVGAHRLAVSRDGNLFVTGDAKGAVKVYTVAGFTLLYQVSAPGSIFGLGFSPDSHRVYEVRDSYGNVWEPSALVQYANSFNSLANDGSEARGLDLTTQVNVSRKFDNIAVLECSPAGNLYCSGTANGVVTLYHVQHGKISTLYSPRASMRVGRLSWSKDGQYVCFADVCRKITVKSIVGDTQPTVEMVAEVPMRGKAKGAISQLVFQPCSSRILVQTTSSLHVISMETFAVISSLELNTTGQIWLVHPQDPSLLMGVASSSITVMDWDLHQRGTCNFMDALSNEADATGLALAKQVNVGSVVATDDKKHVLVQLGVGSEQKTLAYFETSSLLPGADTDGETTVEPITVTPKILAKTTAAQVLRCLSFLPRQRLVFISRSHSVCSVQLPAGPVKEHFVIPGDWVSRELLTLCSVWGKERSFICPKNGEVAVVKSAALA